MTILAIVTAALIALLAAPITLKFRFSWPEGRNDAEVDWAFGLLRKRILPAKEAAAPLHRPAAARRTDRADSADRAERSRQTLRAGPRLIAALRQRTVRRRIARFVSDLWHAVHKKDVSARLRIGLGDPADTGQLWACVGPAAAVLSGVQGVAIHLEPEFNDQVLELSGAGRVRIFPLQLILLLILLMLSPALWRGIRLMRAS